MKRRKIRDASDARASIASMKASGLAAAAWCRSAGIDGRSLRAWMMNLARGAAGGARTSKSGQSARPLVQLVELIPSSPERKDARYVVRVGSHRVEVDDQFDEATLRRLVAVLASC
jgi:hypothetical protein